MLTLVLLVCVLCAAYLWSKYGRLKSSSHALPPAMSGILPFFGLPYLLLKLRTNLLEFVNFASEDCAKQGGVTYSTLGREIWYFIVDHEDALTAANSCLQKHYFYDFAKSWMGDGLGLASGDTWKRHRKLLTPAFSLPVIHGFLDVFNSQSRKLASSVEHHAGEGLFDHLSYLQNNSLETLYAATFGIDPVNDSEFSERYKDAIIEMNHIMARKLIEFWLQSYLIYRLVGLKKKEDKVVEILHTMSNTVLQKKKADLRDKTALDKSIESKTSGIRYKPFLDLLLELSKNGTLTDRQIKDELDTIIAAGFETTSLQLTYILLQLGAHPEVQQKVYEELLDVLGADRDVEKDDVNKLVYTNAVIMESLRTLPPVPLIGRNVDRDVKLKNYTMRAGSCCIIFPLATHLDPSWGPDSDQFRPERWLDGDLRNNKEFAAFALGKRSCIGRTYAMISMTVTLAHFIRQYRVTADMSKLKMTFEYLTRPVAGHEISIERRS